MDTVEKLNAAIIETQRKLGDELIKVTLFKRKSDEYLVRLGECRDELGRLNTLLMELRTKKSILEELGVDGDITYNGASLNERRESNE